MLCWCVLRARSVGAPHTHSPAQGLIFFAFLAVISGLSLLCVKNRIFCFSTRSRWSIKRFRPLETRAIVLTFASLVLLNVFFLLSNVQQSVASCELRPLLCKEQARVWLLGWRYPLLDLTVTCVGGCSPCDAGVQI